MAIDKTGEWWKGSDAGDIDEYLRLFSAGGYAPDRFVHARCPCGCAQFRVETDGTEGVACRTCASCGQQVLMLDSEEYWDDASPEPCVCPCGTDIGEVAVGFAHRPDQSIRWVTIGRRCVACGVLGSPADWKIDYDPTDHLYGRV